MKKVSFLLLLSGVSFHVFSQTRISGTIKGLSAKVDTLYLVLGEHKRLKAIDTCIVHDDSFEFQVSDPEAKIYTVVSWKDIRTEPKGFTFWAETNNIMISGTINDILLNKNLNSHEAYLANLCSKLEKEGSVNQELMNAYINNNKEDLLHYFEVENHVFLKKEKSPKKAIREKILFRTEPFIAEHRNEACSAFILFWLGALEKVIDKKETKRLLGMLTEENIESYYAKLAYDLLDKR